MSGTEQSEYIFTWRIRNFSAYDRAMSVLRSPNFTIADLPGIKWCLRLYYDVNLENFIGLILETLDCYNTVKISARLEIMDEANCSLKNIQLNDKIFNKDNKWHGNHKFFDINELDKKMNMWKDDVLTLRCCIKIDKQSNVIGSVAYTTIGIAQISAEWCLKIPSISEYSDRIKCPFLNLYNLGITLNSKKEVVILISFDKVNESVELPRLAIKMSVYDNTGRKLGWKRDIHLCKNGETWKFPDFITKEMLKSFEMNSFFYEFKLECEISVSKKMLEISSFERFEFSSTCCLESTPKDRPIPAIINDFRKFFQCKKYSDVTIRCKNGDLFPAHKFVLRVRSQVFAAMFDQDMIENKTGIVEISDSDEITIKSFLEYLYTDTVDEINYDIAKDLILTADKYQVPSLIDHCASFLKTKISVENVLEIIAIADIIGYDSFKSYVLNFIKANSAKILSSTEWIKWIEGNIKLATYILSELSADIND